MSAGSVETNDFKMFLKMHLPPLNPQRRIKRTEQERSNDQLSEPLDKMSDGTNNESAISSWNKRLAHHE